MGTYPNWYVYYRLLAAVKGTGPTFHARNQLQDVLVDLRIKTAAEFPEATEQEVQDFFGSLALNPLPFTVRQAAHLTKMEPWGDTDSIKEVLRG